MLVMPKTHLEHLNPTEQQALAEFVQRLKEQFDGVVRMTLLFGSRARGEGAPNSDLDVLVVVDSDDWRVHKQVRYVAADICLKYSLELSPRVWSTGHLQEMERLQAHLYQNIHRDGITLPGL
jgi:predicted nucleotidyltransferase